MTRQATCCLLTLALVAPALAEEDDSLTGSVEVGYRSADINGQEDKYREDVNLSDGALRLFGLELEYEPAESALFDSLSLDARGLGGEPHSSARFELEKAQRYRLDLRYRSSDRFYRDAGYFFRDGGDLHGWDANRSLFDLGLRIQAGEHVAVRLGAGRLERDGHSTTSRRLQEDVFVLDRPVDQTAESYWAAADFRAGWADFTVEQRLESNDNRWLLTASDTGGEDPAAASLDEYRQLRVEEDSASPVTRLSVHGRPSDRFEFSLGYTRADAELDYRVDGDWSGLDFTGSPFDTTLTNEGLVERETDLVEVDLAIGVLESLDVLLDFSSRSWEQDGTIDYLEVQQGGDQAGDFVVRGQLRNELDLDTYGVALDWRPAKTLAITAGVGRQQRSREFQLSGPEIETERTLYRAGVRWRPDPRWNLRLELEQGDDDDPLTPVSPTTTDRIRFRADLRPVEGLAVSLRFVDDSRENDLSTPIGIPTDDVPPADEINLAQFDVTTLAVALNWSRGPVDVAFGYASTDIDYDAHIVFVTDAVLVPVFDIFTTRDRTAYEADQDVVHGNFRYKIGERWSLGARAVVADSSGSFPVDSAIYGADARHDLGGGLYFRAAYDRYDYDEDNPFAGNPAFPTPDVNDYDADLVTLSVGYKF